MILRSGARKAVLSAFCDEGFVFNPLWKISIQEQLEILHGHSTLRIEVETTMCQVRIKLPPVNPVQSPGYNVTIALQGSYETVSLPGDTRHSMIRLAKHTTDDDIFSISRMLARECIDSMMISFTQHDFGGISQASMLTVWPWSKDATLGSIRRLPIERLCQLTASKDLPDFWRKAAAKSPLLNG